MNTTTTMMLPAAESENVSYMIKYIMLYCNILIFAPPTKDEEKAPSLFSLKVITTTTGASGYASCIARSRPYHYWKEKIVQNERLTEKAARVRVFGGVQASGIQSAPTAWRSRILELNRERQI